MSGDIYRRESTPAMASVAFRFRLGTTKDLSQCATMLHPGLWTPTPVRERLPELWHTLLKEGSLRFAAIEDLEQPGSMEAFGFSLFVSDEFIKDFLVQPRPYLATAIYQSILTGGNPVLNQRQIRTANSTTGLHLVPIHAGLRHWGLSHPRTAQAMSAFNSGFFFLHAGYNISSIVGEVHGEEFARFVQRGGYRIIRDFQQERPMDFTGVSSSDWPFLAMASRELSELAANNPVSQLFVPVRPRIGFSAAQQRVLEHALMGETDFSIAVLLCVSVDRVKNIWRDIHEKTEREMPFLTPHQEQSREGTRGLSRRRQLLDYLRLHMEELRPFDPTFLKVRRGSRLKDCE